MATEVLRSSPVRTCPAILPWWIEPALTLVYYIQAHFATDLACLWNCKAAAGRYYDPLVWLSRKLRAGSSG